MTSLLQALADAELARAFEPQVLDRGRRLAPEVAGLSLSDDGAQCRAAARVPGRTAAHEVQLWHAPGTQLRGRCGCAYARRGTPCKHQAAVALAWRAQLAGDTLTAPAPAEENAWQAFLRAQSAAQLAAFVIAQSERLPALALAVQQWQASRLPVNDLASAKKAVSAALSGPRDLLAWRRVGAYVRKAESVLALLQGWTVHRPDIALGAAEWAFARLHRIAQEADDSEGQLRALRAQVATALLQALQAAGPQPASFGQRLDALLSSDEPPLFDLPALLQAAGPEASRQYGERLAAAWARDRDAADPEGARRRSKARLLAYHQAVGDGPAALALLREALRGAAEHIDLVEELQRQQRPREALAAVEAACQQHPDQPRLRALRLAAYEQDGWDAEALRLREADFLREPTLSGYLACLRAAVQAGQAEAVARERLWAALDAKGRGGDETLQTWIGGIRLALWRHEARWDEALTWLAGGGRCPDAALHDFAIALPEDFHAIATELLKPLLQRQMARAHPPFTKELHLVRDIACRQDASARALWLAWLKLEYRTQKRFVEGLVGL